MMMEETKTIMKMTMMVFQMPKASVFAEMIKVEDVIAL